VAKAFVRPSKDGTLLNLRVSPGARSTSIEGLYGERAVRLRIATPPTGGRANAEAEEFLAPLLGVRRLEVAVVQGASSREKTVLIREMGPEEVHQLLAGPVR
jgi:uncharacterized protein